MIDYVAAGVHNVFNKDTPQVIAVS